MDELIESKSELMELLGAESLSVQSFDHIITDDQLTFPLADMFSLGSLFSNLASAMSGSKKLYEATVAANPPVRTITVTSDLTFRRNEYATLSINAQPGAVYSITIYYNSGESTAEGLEPKQADEAGNVSWTWKIGGRTAPGTYQVDISGNGETINKYFTVIVD